MSTGRAKYACDECRSRKIRCSREVGGCRQCKEDVRNCVYSRSGVIRRQRAKQTRRVASSASAQGASVSTQASEAPASTSGELRPQLDEDIDQIQDSLREHGDHDNDALNTLATLEAEYSSFWQGPSLRDMALELGVKEKKFLPFPDEQEYLFTAIAPKIQKKGKPIFTTTPTDILYDIRCNPGNVREKAHLAIIYGILLTEACLDNSYDKTTITKLRWNLRLSLDDAQLLLEPSDLNIQALTLLACHVQEVSTPSLCWMMISNACRMLQSLGINSRTVNSETRERRLLLFWFLNALDKNLALIFGRAPTLHKAMCAKLPLVEWEKMLEFAPHIPMIQGGTPFRSVFGAHLMRRMHISGIVLSDIWSCIYDDGSKFDLAKGGLDLWWKQTSKVLQASILTETAFVGDAAELSMRLGIKSIEFHYNYLKVVLMRSKPAMREECVASARQALLMLEDLVSDSNEVYNGIVWLLLYCPFTPFFTLLGEVLSTGSHKSKQASLEAMEKLPIFLARMRPRHPQAAKLHIIADTLVRYATDVLTKTKTVSTTASAASNGGTRTSERMPECGLRTPMSELTGSNTSIEFDPPAWMSSDQQPLQELFSNPFVKDLSMDWDSWLPSDQSDSAFWQRPSGTNGMRDTYNGGSDPYGFFADSNFDWFSWDPNLDNFLL